ncbi:hypothetical protein SCHPADRAFT_146021 [Schizopora paradoxa]|uniref:Uncharacterized protein n=1 Tax=Schizopora paradoxa TaxID=27342 RepID=A0A0H2S893_9AGAM|nr:hypothetical protein SCHPADRAFT_146021 [Schizopora paradoxa]
MSNAARIPLNPEDVTLGKAGGPVRFENQSDTIFASLFLPVSESENDSENDSHYYCDCLNYNSESIPWQFCDRILRVIRNPQFNSKDVTFKDCGDMFGAIGRRRDHMWSLVEARPTCDSPSSLPLVILVGVLDYLKIEIISRIFQVPIESRYLDNRLRVEDNAGVLEWKQTLRNMMLVHSSWHARVKRLLGYSIISTQGLTPAFVQNPLYGEWTRELCLKSQFDLESSDFDSDSTSIAFFPDAPILPRGFSSICAYISNIRVVHLCLRELPNRLASVCDVLSRLTSLEELTLEDFNGEIPFETIFATISKARLSTLRVLRFYANRYKYDDSSIHIRFLESLEMLHSVQLIYPDPLRERYEPPNIGACSVLWSRNTLQRGSSFMLSELLIHCAAESEVPVASRYYSRDPQWEKMFDTAKLVEFQVVGPQKGDWLNILSEFAEPSTIAHSIGPWLGRCSSSRTLVFRGFLWMRIMMFEQVIDYCPNGVLANVEELIIEITSLPLPVTTTLWEHASDMEKEVAKAKFSANDEKLSQVVGAGLFPGMRILKVIFPEEELGYYVERFEDARKRGDLGLEERRMLLPHCKQRCSERSISLFVEIV